MDPMSNLFKNSTKTISRALELLLGGLGGVLWAFSLSLGLLFLFRADYMAGSLAALCSFLAFAGFLAWGLIRARVFMCYAIPLAMLLVAGDSPALNEVIPKRPVFSILLLFVGLIALCLAAIVVEIAAFEAYAR
jgi:hypothetical protein